MIEDRIESAAELYRDNCNRMVMEGSGLEETFDAAIKLAFIEGAKFVSDYDWHTLGEEMPRDEETVMIKTKNEYKVVGYYSEAEDLWIIDGFYDKLKSSEIMCWRYPYRGPKKLTKS